MVQDPQGAVTHTADPAHAVTANDQGTQPVAYANPVSDDGGLSSSLGLYPGEEYVVSTPGLVLDTTPETHEFDAGEHGAEIAATYAEKPMQFADEQYLSARFEGLGGEDINPVALQRGLNGLSVNNPDGFRQGYDGYSWVNRHFAVARQRYHDLRIIYPDLPYAPTDAQTAPPVAAGPYPTSFGALARAITSVNQTPQSRREPPPMLADQVSDGGPIVPAVDSWVVG
jgi:hypothetical protein